MVDLNDNSINLRALKKIDASIREIILCGGQVAVYYYDSNKENWYRKNIEGTLFFVKRSTMPECAFIVINRLSTINFVQKITKDLETNMHSPYLMYKNNEKEIYCIWFYDQNQCISLNEKISSTIDGMKKNQGSFQSVSNSINNNQFNGLTTNKNISQKKSELLKKMLCLDNNNEKLLADVSTISNTEPEQKQSSVMKQSPLNDLNKSNTQAERSFNLRDLFNKSKLSNIETSTPIKEARSDVSFHDSNKNDLLSTSANIPPILADEKKILPSSLFHGMSMANSEIKTEIERKQKEMEISNTNSNFFDAIILKNSNSLSEKHQSPTLTMTTSTTKSNSNMYLTMEQLKQTLIYLLKNDADFLHTIHTAYVENIKANFKS